MLGDRYLGIDVGLLPFYRKLPRMSGLLRLRPARHLDVSYDEAVYRLAKTHSDQSR